jgi:hypothetical protein
MTEEKQSLSPAEWKSIGDYLIQLSEKVQQASRPSTQVSEPKREPTGQILPTDK